MLTNDNWDRYLWIGVLLPHGGPSPSKKSNFSFMVQFGWNLKWNIFIYLPTIIESKIYKWESLCSPPPPPPQKVNFFIYGAILLKFWTEHFHMFTNNNWDYNLNMRVPSPPPQKSKIVHLSCNFAEIWNSTFSYVYQ